MSHNVRRRVGVILLAVGAAVAWPVIAYHDPVRPGVWLAVLLALLLPALPSLRRALAPRLNAMATPRPSTRQLVALVLLVIAPVCFYFVHVAVGRDFFSKIHDEYMYLLQATMLARGRLWMPPHPMGEFFETMFVIVRPVYAAIYFPGTALAHVPVVWLHLPPWVLPLVIGGATLALTYRVTSELTDGISGALAVVLLVGLPIFRYYTFVPMSHPLMAMLGMAMLFAWLRWRASPTAARAAVLGAVAGWAAITRPVDAVAYALPIGVAVLLHLRHEPWRRWAWTLAAGTAAACPFLALQLVLNVGTTGRLLATPYTEYLRQYQPNSLPGFRAFDETARPQTELQQKHDYYDVLLAPALRRHRLERVPMELFAYRLPLIGRHLMPSPLLLVLLAVGLLAMGNQRWVVLGVLVTFLALYTFNPFFPTHYYVSVTPVIAFAIALGAYAVRTLATTPRWQARVTVAVTAVVVVLAASELPGIEPRPTGNMETPLLAAVEKELAALPADERALVLFRYRPGDNFQEEPVYNSSTAWPDDARIIRAHDRGPDNARIIAYYAEHQPDRHVYLYDRRERRMYDLGPASEAVTRPATTMPSE